VSNFTFTAVLAHYGDSFWIKEAILRGNLVAERSIEKIYIIDQNRGDESLREFTKPFEKIEVVQFPVNGSGNSDHARALNSLFAEYSFQTSHILIMDSDLIAQKQSWLNAVIEILNQKSACLALDPISDYLTHPCFMVIPTNLYRTLDFEEGMTALKVDTGRTIGIQLHNLGASIELLRPRKSYGGEMGFSYLNSSLYHVTSVSIRQQPSRRKGKTSLQINLAESWRRWVINSRLSKSDSKVSAYLFLLARLIFCIWFVVSFIYKKCRMKLFSASNSQTV
jgi:hypothetical protein